MTCPKCKSPMETVSLVHIEVNRCTECKGIWFDLLEAERVAELADSERIDTGDPEVGRGLDAIARVQCPVCGSRMIRMVDRLQPHIHYESCTVCHGVFFDAGEFADFKVHTLLERLRELLPRKQS